MTFPIFRPVHIVWFVYLSPQLSPAKALGKNEIASADLQQTMKTVIATTFVSIVGSLEEACGSETHVLNERRRHGPRREPEDTKDRVGSQSDDDDDDKINLY